MIYKIDNKQIWESVSEKLFLLMRNKETSTTKLFAIETDGTGQNYINIDLEMECPLFINTSNVTLISEIGEILQIPSEEGVVLREYLTTNNTIKLKQIVPSSMQEYTPIYNE